MTTKVCCIYCDRKTCDCGGERRVIKQRAGDVLVCCKKCSNTWIHYHRHGRGRALP